MADSDASEALVRRRPRWRLALLALVALLLLAMLALWLARAPIASDLIDRELARRGVAARYQVKRIGLRTQRLEGLSIGDPRAPDLTARWVEVDLRPTLGAPEVRAIRAGGVRLRGQLIGGRVRLGAIERLLPRPTGARFRLPDLPVALDDAELALATPAGMLTIALTGRGNLAQDFAGRYQARAPRLQLGDCTLAGLQLQGRVSSRSARPRFAGPLQAAALTCAAGQATQLSGTLDATLEPALDGWRGAAALASGPVTAQGWTAMGTRGQLDFAGTGARTGGTLRLAALELAGPQGRSGRAELGGSYALESGRPEQLGAATSRALSLRFEGGLTAAALDLANAPRLDGLAQSLAGTPLAPLAAAFARAAAELGADADLRASVSLATRGDQGSLRIGNARLRGGGATLGFAGGEGVRLVWPGTGEWQVDGAIELAGAGVPRVAAELRQSGPGAPISGLARMAPFASGSTRIALTPVRFAGNRFTTRIEASGPLLGGRVERATLPIDGVVGAGRLVLNRGCAPLGFERLTVSGLTLAPAALRLCPAGRALVTNGRLAAVIAAPRLAGTLGSSPITLAASSARIDGNAFRINGLAARLGAADRVSRLDLAQLTGTVANGVTGRFTGATGQVGKVPLVVDQAAGRWRYAAGLLSVDGSLRLSDAAAPSRFHPLASRDFSLRIRGNDLTAAGRLLAPDTGTLVTQVALRHDLGRGVGSADLDVDALRFAPEGLQPDQITRLTLGVIADVDATLSGRGRIDWNPEAVTSSGRFQIAAASLAAPFGPVTGLATELRFTDLLGLETAPDQTLTVATVNPGILVEQGTASYRILPGFRVAVAGARWPFAGGELTLRPTVLDFSRDAARALTFDIQGLDAARFVNALQFSNINATGTFDGTLPMIFDADGGRVVDGRLVSRAPGGGLSYNGEVSNADLGVWGDIAFDALKSIAYQTMTIGIDGRIDGEMLSQIRFNGVSRGTIEPVATGLIARLGGQLATELQRIPFIFNIQIRAPFRGLIAMARSFDDPSLLIQDQLGPRFEAVQPSATEDKR